VEQRGDYKLIYQKIKPGPHLARCPFEVGNVTILPGYMEENEAAKK
jgi:hypothetical protein